VVSIDWITQCIQEDQRVDLAPYRITYEPEGYEVDIKMEEEAETIPESAPPTKIQWQATETVHSRLLTRNVSTQPPQASVPVGIEHFVKEEITEERMAEPVIEEMVNTDLLEDDDDDDFFMILDHIPPVKKIIRRTLERDLFPTPPRTPAIESARFASPSYSESLTSIGEADFEDHIPKSTRSVAVKDPREVERATPIITDSKQRRKLINSLVAPRDRIPFEELEERLLRWSSEGFPGTQKDFLADLQVEVRIRTFWEVPKAHRGQNPKSVWHNIYRNYNKVYYRLVPGLEDQGNPKLRGTKPPLTAGPETKGKRIPKGKTARSKSSASKAPEQELASMFVQKTKYM
jgi:hypothetical protein